MATVSLPPPSMFAKFRETKEKFFPASICPLMHTQSVVVICFQIVL